MNVAQGSVIEITSEELHIVQCLLRAYLPEDSKVWIFGSRTNGRAKPASDLDLAVDAGKRISLGVMGSLIDTFEVAPLPYKVDIVDLQTASPEFRASIDAHKIPFPGFDKIDGGPGPQAPAGVGGAHDLLFS